MENYFARLNQVSVSEHIEKKGSFSYLSWPFAVAQLRLADPGATWEVRRFDGKPYLRTECGYFVEVAVTVQGATLSQIHPVLDGKNRTIAEPTAFDINTSIQRCLVKAIALHGLGLYIYAGEDLPDTSEPKCGASTKGSAKRKTGNVVPLESGDSKSVGHKLSSAKHNDDLQRINTAQRRHIEQLITETGADINRLLTYFSIRSLDEIPAAQYARVVRSLEARRAA